MKREENEWMSGDERVLLVWKIKILFSKEKFFIKIILFKTDWGCIDEIQIFIRW